MVCKEKAAVAQAEVKKQKTGFSAFGYWRPKRNWLCFLLQQEWKFEKRKGTMFNLSKYTDYIKALCCYVLIPQETKISRLVGKERKGSWGGAEMFWLWSTPSTVTWSPLSCPQPKSLIRKRGGRPSRTCSYCGQPEQRHYPPPSILPFYGEKHKRPSLGALSAIIKHFQALGWKVFMCLSPLSPSEKQHNISILYSRYLRLLPERFQTLTKGQSAQACSFFNREEDLGKTNL